MTSTALIPMTINSEEEVAGRNREEDGDRNREEEGLESEDEEAWDREAYEIQNDVLNFTDEPQVEHSHYLESDKEAEKGYKTQRNDNQGNRGPGYLRLGMTFFNAVEFKEAVVEYVLRTAKNIKQYRYDTNRVAYKCVGKECDWRIYCSVTGSSEAWKVRLFHDVHSCLHNGKVEMMKVPVIARLFVEKIRADLDYFLPKKMESFMFEKWIIKASRHQCQTARKKTLKWIEREYYRQFSHLHDCAAEILLSNENSTVEIGTVTNEEGLEVFS